MTFWDLYWTVRVNARRGTRAYEVLTCCLWAYRERKLGRDLHP